jgi:hypothetical protein
MRVITIVVGDDPLRTDYSGDAGLVKWLPKKNTKILSAALLIDDLDLAAVDFSRVDYIVTDQRRHEVQADIGIVARLLKALPSGTLLTSFNCNFR